MGLVVGAFVGATVGFRLGTSVGAVVGANVGLRVVGTFVGAFEGLAVGTVGPVGASETDGLSEGEAWAGTATGKRFGCREGDGGGLIRKNNKK